MSTTAINTTVNPSNPYLDAMLGSTQWSTSGTLTYYLEAGDWDGNGTNDWNQDGAGTAIRRAFEAWDAVCNLNISETSNPANADITEIISDAGGDPSVLGFHYYPNNFGLGGEFNQEHDVWNYANNQVGGYSYITLIHEIGHGLGLEHPFEAGDGDVFAGVGSTYDTGDHGLNQGIWTVMSYNDGWDEMALPPSNAWGWAGSPMAFDIAAAQALYGANMNHQKGSDTYNLPDSNGAGAFFSCIWDAGGTDTISAAGNSRDTTINLNDATLRNEAGGGGYVSQSEGVYGGFTIANGVRIENATGGQGDDLLIGNEFNNVLKGGAGRDDLRGGAGSDTASYAGASEGVWASLADPSVNQGDAFGDTYSSIGNLTGSSHGDVLTGDSARNAIYGGSGGAGDDLRGGGGADTFIFKSVKDSGTAASAWDTIFDFLKSQTDQVDLRSFDANSKVSGAQDFAFIGTKGFTGKKLSEDAGELRFVKKESDTYIYGDLNRDKKADFTIHFDDAISFSKGDFLL